MTHQGLVLHEYGKMPVWEQFPKPVLKQGELLVKVEGAALNPSDRYRTMGVYFPIQLPNVLGLEGAGTVVQANGADLQSWVKKRVCFLSDSGSWGEYSVCKPSNAFQISADVPLESAASGIVNPLTVLAMLDTFTEHHPSKGIIHTAAASALGRMLNQVCITHKIHLLNIVRKKEHADLLKSEGAEHVIITEGDWEKEYIDLLATHKFNVLFDALGGGPITQKLITNLPGKSSVYIYGMLEGKPLTLSNAIGLSKGVSVTGLMLFNWWSHLVGHKADKIREKYSHWLKKELATHSLKSLPMSKFEEAWQLSTKQATSGKVTLIPS